MFYLPGVTKNNIIHTVTACNNLEASEAVCITMCFGVPFSENWLVFIYFTATRRIGCSHFTIGGWWRPWPQFEKERDPIVSFKEWLNFSCYKKTFILSLWFVSVILTINVLKFCISRFCISTGLSQHITAIISVNYAHNLIYL